MIDRTDLEVAFDMGMSDAYAESMNLRKIANPFTADSVYAEQYDKGYTTGVELIRAEIALYGDR